MNVVVELDEMWFKYVEAKGTVRIVGTSNNIVYWYMFVY